MRTMMSAACAALLMSAGPAIAQNPPDDPLVRACRLVASNLIERETATDMTAFRVHREVTVKWVSSDLGPREHVCHFLSGDASVPEIVGSLTRTGAEERQNQWLRDQNGLIWACFVNQPDLPVCVEGSELTIWPTDVTN